MTTIQEHMVKTQLKEIKRLDRMIKDIDGQIKEYVDEGYPNEAARFVILRDSLVAQRKKTAEEEDEEVMA